MKRWAILAGLGIAGALLFTATPITQAQDGKPAAAQGGGPFGGLDLVGGLKKTEGCLGVETARTSSGKSVIFAWFENKKAAMNWYNSPDHMKAMMMMGPQKRQGEPMAGVPDDIPVLAIASVTFSDKPKFKDIPFPISQIAIELYTPVTGGLFLGERFAPEGLKVPDMKNYTPPK